MASGVPEGHVLLGEEVVEFPSDRLRPLPDSSRRHRDGDMDGLRGVLERDGLLFLRGVVPREAVLEARSAVLAAMAESGDVLDESFGTESAVLKAGCGIGCVPFLEGGKQLPEVMAVAECDELRGLFRGLLGCEPLTLDYKWLRAVPRRRFTGAHMDAVYMCRGSPRLLTCWIPMGDTPLRMGGLALIPGSHRSDGFARVRRTYGAVDFEGAGLRGSGWLTEDAADAERLGGAGAVWHAADYQAGDVVVFGMHTLHMSTANCTDMARLSMDVRWQPASEPADARYMGEAADPGSRVRAGAYGADDEAGGGDATGAEAASHPGVAAGTSGKAVADLRAEWGF